MEDVRGALSVSVTGDCLDMRLKIGPWEAGLGPRDGKSRVGFVAAETSHNQHGIF